MPVIKKINVKRQRSQFVEDEYLDEKVFQEKVYDIFKEKQLAFFIFIYIYFLLIIYKNI